ncbi:ABC transporter ATP-binding protein [Micromonospora craniellae]|uniref:ABC transporter ATP-binding protein n=1 Tax=Micromonospora craniellae TaxID=2294034 RepID=A0A372G399_9ACTN|nr:ABC transporter ATP-binding protein [Micromonospora craniellae]QOC92010.1 ABC transporter ATP-binding protein [Micromonospora craniellae]RFS47525.1 ABC transporter ATP-binding protein [Micromonospora craniellae]
MSATTILPVASGRVTVATFWRNLRRCPLLAWASVVTSVAASGAAVVVPILLGRLVDLVVAGGSVDALLATSAWILGAGLMAAVLTGASRWLVTEWGMRACADLREEVLDRALRMDSARLESAGSGDVASRVTGDVEQVADSIRLAAGIFTALVTVVITFAGFATLDWRIALAFLIVFPVHVLSLRRFVPRAKRLYAAEREAAAVRTQSLLTTFTGARTVHAYGMAQRQGQRVDGASRNAVTARLRAVRGFLWFANMMNYAEAIGLTAVLLTGFLLVRAGESSVGDVTAAALLFHRLFGPLGMLLISFNDVQSAGAALARLVGITGLDVPESRARAGDRPAGGIGAKAIGHHYPGGPTVVHDVSVEIAEGESLAVVGESGAGKTTLAAILGGVFPAAEGEVLLGGRPIADLDPAELRRTVGVVTQEVHVFAGTLADDLRLAAPDAAEEQLWEALRLVGADQWVAALPEGLHTRVGEGDHPVTPGQAQQVALARVALLDPPIVVLDEASAEAGSAGARQLELASAALVRGRTAVVVAHRLTQAQSCDRIAVMAHGRIVELGTPEELVAAGGRYAELWAAWQR